MRFQLLIHDVKPDELPDVVEVLGDCHVDSLNAVQGRFSVTSKWINDDAHWLLMNVSELERRVNADDHEMHAIWIAKNQRGIDCTEDQAAAIKRYWDTHDPMHLQTASRLRTAFPTRYDEWVEAKETG